VDCETDRSRAVLCSVSAKSRLLIELADGVTLDEVKSKTEANFRVALKNT
jgi:acyl CoA:acetate/3-ketoacid CoA transferase beta subunit